MKYFSGGRKYYNVWCWATMCVPPESTCLATPPVRPPSLMVASLETLPNPSSIPTWFVPASGAPPHLTKVCSVRAPVLNPVTPTRTTLALFPVWTRPLLPGYFWHYFPFFVILLIISALFVELLVSDGVALLNSNQLPHLPHEGESDDNFSHSL